MPDKVRIGKIVGCHGIRGDLKVRPTSPDPEWPSTARQLFIGEKPYKVLQARPQGPLILTRLEGVDSRTLAETLVGSVLYVSQEDLGEPGEDEYWADDLIGLSVMDAQTGRKRGIVKDLLSSAGSDFLEIQLEDSTETVVVPFITQFFPTVDLENKTVTVDLLGDFLSDVQPVTTSQLEE